ncbi:MAG: spore coat protein [Bacilli bacterium]|jgi:spore coat protein CotF|nr:spore coat protein [Bacilli bacterium]
MSNELVFNNYLMLLKGTVEVYIHGTLESSNEDVKETLKTSLDDILNSQKDTFNIMVENNWYEVNNVKTNVIDQTYKKLTNQ